jgi:hypothetical protein
MALPGRVGITTAILSRKPETRSPFAFLAGTASGGGGGRDPDAGGAGSSAGSGEILGLKGARAGAEAALAGRFPYPEPIFHVVRGYPELQTQEAPAPSSRILPSQERYRGVWCARAFFG